VPAKKSRNINSAQNKNATQKVTSIICLRRSSQKQTIEIPPQILISGKLNFVRKIKRHAKIIKINLICIGGVP
jgi:predicted ATP-dependent endonuclease of OLD family